MSPSQLCNRQHLLVTAVMISLTRYNRKLKEHKISFAIFCNANIGTGFPRFSLIFDRVVKDFLQHYDTT